MLSCFWYNYKRQRHLLLFLNALDIGTRGKFMLFCPINGFRVTWAPWKLVVCWWRPTFLDTCEMRDPWISSVQEIHTCRVLGSAVSTKICCPEREQWAVSTFGPYQSPGPDGIRLRLLQQVAESLLPHWSLVGTKAPTQVPHCPSKRQIHYDGNSRADRYHREGNRSPTTSSGCLHW